MVLFNDIPNPYSLCAAAKTETWLSYENVDQNRIEQNKEPKMSDEYDDPTK